MLLLLLLLPIPNSETIERRDACDRMWQLIQKKRGREERRDAQEGVGGEDAVEGRPVCLLNAEVVNGQWEEGTENNYLYFVSHDTT